MCGIACVVRPRIGGRQIHWDLDRMRPGIAPRGPDGTGRFVEAGLGLLNTRLAVMDPSRGAQPMWNESGDIACVYNGELYGFRSTADRLKARGHRFSTTSDTELLVHLYEDHGAELVEHLSGMFAFAIYDRHAATLLLARDRLGMKPLYWASLPDGYAFASSISSLVALQGVSRDPDAVSIAHFYRYYKVPEPDTAFGSVKAIPPGHRVRVDLRTGALACERYHDWPPEPPDRNIDGDCEAIARDSLRRAVASHVDADVEVGAFLSGGVDSSLVVSEAQRLIRRPLRTYSVSFPGHRGFDEARQAENVAQSLGSRHETVEVTGAPVELIRDALAAAQQPFAVASFIPLLSLSRRAAMDIKVVLTGDGGDEVGVGYRWYRLMRQLRKLPHLSFLSQGAPALHALERAVSGSPRGAAVRRALKFARGAILDDPGTVDAWRYDLSATGARDLLAPGYREVARTHDRKSPNALAWRHDLPPVESFRQADLEVLLRDEMLPKVDRASMAAGLEARLPLLDDTFVASMRAVPIREHLAHPSGKTLLRRWATEQIPGFDPEQPKHGFDVPIHSWLRGGLNGELHRLLLDHGGPSLCDRAAARKVVRRMDAGVPGAAHTAFALVIGELWFEELNSH